MAVVFTLTQDRSYRCRSVAFIHDEVAFVQLDRAVSAPLASPLGAAENAASGEAVAVIGYPSGLPVKVDAGARVLAVQHDLLSLASDTFVGSSGSGVFDRRGDLVAIVIRGAVDYTRDPDRDCFVTRHVEEIDNLVAEQAQLVRPALEALAEHDRDAQGCVATPRATRLFDVGWVLLALLWVRRRTFVC